jgi:glutathione S-transferase
MPQYKVTYFDIRGLAETIRQILIYAGIPFEDVRIPLGGLTPEKKEELGLEWGQVPLLEIDGEKKSQSYAICRFLAKKFNLAGKNENEEFRADEIVEAVRDYTLKSQPMFASIFGSDQSKLEEQKKQFAEVDSPVYLGRFNKLLEKQGKTYLVGDSLTYADILFAHFVTQFEMVFEMQLQKDYPAVQKLIAAVHNEPKIKEWIETRPKTKF